jgi:hypothetical protein
MSRKSLGIAAALLLAVGIFIWWRGPGGENALGLAYGCIRVGLVLGALWLAFPQILALMKGAPGWLVGWFFGKGKPPAKSSSNAPQAEVVSQPTKEKRPRRRSNA